MTQSLSDRLHALAGEAAAQEGRARILCETGATPDHILDEIDTTVLASALTFNTGDAQLTLHVAGRRLHMISGPSIGLDVPEDLLERPISMEDADARARIADILHRLLEASPRLSVTSTPSSDLDAEGGDSLSLAALQADLGLDLSLDDDHLPAIERFIARVEGQVQAYIRLSGNRLQSTQGAVSDISSLKIALTTQLSKFQMRRNSDCPSHSEPSLTLLAEVQQPGCGLGLAVHGEDTLLFSVENSNFPHVFKAFNRLM